MSYSSISHEAGQVSATSDVCEALAYSILPYRRSGPNNSAVIAFTSANRGEGVSYVVRSVMRAMNVISPGRTFRVDIDWLKNQPLLRPVQAASEDLDQKQSGNSGFEYRGHVIQQLRSRFQFSAIDCPALGAEQ